MAKRSLSKKAVAKEQATKTKVTLAVTPELAQRVRDAVVNLQGPPEFLTMSDLAEKALTKEVERLEKAHNGSEPFPHQGRNKGGRPVKR